MAPINWSGLYSSESGSPLGRPDADDTVGGKRKHLRSTRIDVRPCHGMFAMAENVHGVEPTQRRRGPPVHRLLLR